jgi:hypothetical protein
MRSVLVHAWSDMNISSSYSSTTLPRLIRLMASAYSWVELGDRRTRAILANPVRFRMTGRCHMIGYDISNHCLQTFMQDKAS